MSELPIDVETILHEAKQFLDSHADFCRQLKRAFSIRGSIPRR